MNIQIVARHFELSDSIKTHAHAAIASLEKFNLNLIATHVIITEEKHNKIEFEAEFTINIAHHETIVVKKTDKDAHAAIDLAIASVQKVLRKYHDKTTEHKADREAILKVDEE